MKIIYVVGCALLVLALGCKQESKPAPPTAPETKTISDGNTTWALGATRLNGTNIALTNVTIRAVTNQAPR